MKGIYKQLKGGAKEIWKENKENTKNMPGIEKGLTGHIEGVWTEYNGNIHRIHNGI